MKKVVTVVLVPIILAFGVWAFLQGRKEMQKEREREKPVQTAPRAKKTEDGATTLEFDSETLRLSDVKTQKISGELPVDAIVFADGSGWYFVETQAGVFQRRSCEPGNCTVSGESVVVNGAQTLLSEERKNIIQIGEESKGSK